MIGKSTQQNSAHPVSNDAAGRILAEYFSKYKGGEYFSHLNGSDIVITRKSTMRWDWSVDGRVHEKGSSSSLNEARFHSWHASLNDLEKRAWLKGNLSVP